MQLPSAVRGNSGTPPPALLRLAFRVRAAWRITLVPTAVAVAVSAGLVLGLALIDRGGEPGVVVGGAAGPFDSLAGAVHVAVGLLVTWVGLLVVGTGVAWSIGYELEHDLDETLHAHGATMGRRLVANFLASMGSVAIVAVVLAALVFVVGVAADGWSPPADADRLELDPALVSALVMSAMFWWVLAAALALVTRSSAVTLGALTGGAFACLLLTRQDALVAYLPVTWLGEIAGFERGGSALTDVWASGSGLIGISWTTPGPMSMSAIALTTVAFALALGWRSSRWRVR